MTIRDSDDNMQWSDDNSLLTYRARKIYHVVPELSAEGYKDPEKVFVTGIILVSLLGKHCFWATKVKTLPWA